MDAGDHDTSIDHDFFLQGLTGDYGPFDTSAAGDDGPDGEPPVGSHPDPGDAAGVPSSGSTSAHTLASSGSKRSRAGTSEVWQDFERIYKEEDGVSVRYAKCYICKNELSAKPSGGTGHLKRHAISCKRKSGAAMKQTVLQYNPDGSVHHWEYDSANARKELCRFIARADLPLNIGSSSRSSDSSSRSSTGTGIPTSGGELTTFIDSDVISHEQENFNILQWWHEHKTNYPVLSLLARDLLTVPVSTVSSEAAFSLTGRIIEERRTNLSSEMVEILTIVKDWEQAEARMQHTAENTELEESFQNLYLDADENV
ncbi:uncharacterized protein LOC133905724 isoform X1 [Phragmites australis]|uniref:uncharacterized protein LOC133904271 isoform X1 n=1 Tax=Phragmites australis TaxID=29695 RepID=UPI002D79DC05|nr:uncharacterized protein LOC133904271 isoform X1 [Phragmites australis]XP_062203470.1 uncharacterized protein LOC133905724 isoform X1 [Phragmites australis]